MKAIITVDVPEYQIGQEVSVYFKDTMCVKGTCESEKVRRTTGEEKKKCCRDCKYLNGQKHSVGIECTNPNRTFRSFTAMIKSKATPACKMFEQKDTE